MARLVVALVLGSLPIYAFAETVIPRDSVTNDVNVRATRSSSDLPPLDYVQSHPGRHAVRVPDRQLAPTYVSGAERHWLLAPPVREVPMYWVNMATHGWDIYQTCQFKDRNHKEVIAEWAIGTRPTCHDVMLAGVGGAVLMHLTDRFVSRRWPRAGWALRHAFAGFRIHLSNDNRRRQR